MSVERLQKKSLLNAIHDCDKAGCGLFCKTTRQRRFGESQLLSRLDRAIEAVAERTAGSDTRGPDTEKNDESTVRKS
jgi:hypothetical protein